MAKTVHEFFKAAVAKRRHNVAAQYKVAGTWRDVTWAELDTLSNQVSAALVHHGVQPREHVCILSHTVLEWIIADVGIMGAGASTIPIYQSSVADEVQYILHDSSSVLVFAQDREQLDKLRGIRDQIPSVRKVVCFDAEAVDLTSPWELSWQQFLEDGAAFLRDDDAAVSARSDVLGPDDTLTIIYTSGTTGRPKGAVLTHDSMIAEADALESLGIVTPEDVQYLFLPMAHVFAKAIEVLWFRTAHIMAFWEGDQAKIIDNLAEVRPTMMASVPRIFEKVHAKVTGDMKNGAGLAGVLGRWALAQAEAAAALEQQGKAAAGLSWSLAKWLVFSKVEQKLKERFGGRLRFFISGGAPLSRDIAYFFQYAGVSICEGYGLTETSAGATINRPGDVNIGTVGTPLPGVEVKIAPDGEILMRGRIIMRGYWNKPDATREAIDEDGWFHSGDIGVIDEQGRLRITDRKKDLIITAGGKNVAPQNLENGLKSKSPLISQVVVHGDQRKYLTALVTIDVDNAKGWATKEGIPGFDYAAVSQHPKMREEIQAVVADFNKGLASYETLKKVHILDHDFEIGDQLTPTMKVKRKHCNERYKTVFESLYGDG
ncbi:MAG: AMP-dependent synthetase/ligase [Myxococcota bacterium]